MYYVIETTDIPRIICSYSLKSKISFNVFNASRFTILLHNTRFGSAVMVNRSLTSTLGSATEFLLPRSCEELLKISMCLAGLYKMD